MFEPLLKYLGVVFVVPDYEVREPALNKNPSGFS
jgi:hypothetical protein